MEILDGKDYLEEIKELIYEYSKSLNRDLSFQSLEEELKDSRKKYSGSEGRSLALLMNGKVVGCVAYHKLSDTRCEMKRLYVKPEARGVKAGESLVEKIISAARENGFAEMVLDTIRPLKAAIHLYKKFGFVECEAYYNNPMPDVIYMKKKLLRG